MSETVSWSLADRELEFGPPIAVGIVNVTDDSFFEGARSGSPEQAVRDGVDLAEAGFEMLDVGAVAARSGPPVDAAEEAAALVPAIAGLVSSTELPVSADTFSAEVAERAVEAGAVAINDISGGGDEAMLELAARSGCGLVVMHIEGPPRVERDPPEHDDPVEHLTSWFAERIGAANAVGVEESQIVIDPGIDFDLGVAEGLEVLRRLGELRELGRPLYVSLSRKDLLGAVLGGSWEQRVDPAGREWATSAASALAVAQGADLLRLHDESALQTVRVAERIIG
ncbi:MAG: dihydropteroate synthase [Solirubrobacterales bacterium]